MKPLSAAMLDKALLGKTFANPTFAAWRTVAKILEGQRLDKLELARYRELTGRQNPPSGPFSEAYIVKPRRAGGSLFASALGLHAALEDYRDRLGPGEVATVAMIASDRRQARQLMNYCRGLISDSPIISGEVIGETAETVSFEHRTQLEVHTTSFRSTRGYSYAAVICDEMAFWRDEFSATPDIELIRAVRPGLSNLGGRLLGLSSPHARRGHLFDMYQRYFGKDGSDVLVIKAQHSQLNPTIDPKVIERAMLEDPEAAKAEWFGEFRGDVAQWMPDELIDAALEGRTGGRKRQEVAFVDVSGGRHDASCLAIAHAEDVPGDKSPPRLVLDVLDHVRAPHEPDTVIGKFCDLLKGRRISKIVGDRYGAEFVAGAFKRRGIAYESSELDKSSIYLEVMPAFAERRVTLINDKRLVTELRMLERRPRSGGKPDQVDHSSNAHDDAANAVCGALWQADANRGRMSYFGAAGSLPSVESVMRGVHSRGGFRL